MKQSISNSEMSVALLMSDLKEAKELSDVFRQAGIVPHIYESLESFWYGTLNKLPGLSMVDVRLMSEGDLVLKSHPKVKSEEMNLAFYYSEESEPLMYSAYELNHLGVVRKAPIYKAQIKGILKRLNTLNQLKNENFNLSSEVQETESKMNRLVATTEELKEESFYQKFLKSVCGRFELQRNAESFHSAVERVFATMPEVKEFSILELSHNGQKLVSPEIYNTKFKEIPSLWLGQTCQNGIEFFAQNMASQVTLDLVGGELMSLLIKGKSENPDQMIFIRTEDEDFLARFDWESFERYLSGFYTSFELRTDVTPSGAGRILTPWELFSSMDHFRFDTLPGLAANAEISSDVKLIDLDFSDMVDLARAQKGMRFYWRKFFTDFFARFENQKKHDVKIVSMGIEHIGLVVSEENSEQVFSDIKSYALRYPYWKYFDNVDVVLARNMKPTIQMIPYAVEAYLRYIEAGSVDGIYTNSNLEKGGPRLSIREKQSNITV